MTKQNKEGFAIVITTFALLIGSAVFAIDHTVKNTVAPIISKQDEITKTLDKLEERVMLLDQSTAILEYHVKELVRVVEEKY